MDSLTQIVLGAAVGELVLGRKVGNKAILWGAIAGTIPDLDVLNRAFFSDLGANELHRGVTHSILFSVVMAPLLGHWLKRDQRSLLSVFLALIALVFFVGTTNLPARAIIVAVTAAIVVIIFRKVKRSDPATAKDWSWLFWWALITHPLLDCHTTWGTQLLWPLPVKVAYNNIFVVDPSYTLPFLVCVAITMCYKRNDPRRRWINGFGLILSSAYMVLTIVLKFIAYSNIERSVQRQGIAYTSISTRPTPFNSILWNTNVECDDHFDLGYYSLLDTKPEVELVSIPKNHALLGGWADDEMVNRLRRLSDDNYVIQLRNDTLLFCDLRFGQIGKPAVDKPFVYSYKLIPQGSDLRVELVPPPNMSGDQFNAVMEELWARINGE